MRESYPALPPEFIVLSDNLDQRKSMAKGPMGCISNVKASFFEGVYLCFLYSSMSTCTNIYHSVAKSVCGGRAGSGLRLDFDPCCGY